MFHTVTPSAARGRRVGVIALPTKYRVPTLTRSIIHMTTWDMTYYVECEGTCEVVNRGERVWESKMTQIQRREKYRKRTKQNGRVTNYESDNTELTASTHWVCSFIWSAQWMSACGNDCNNSRTRKQREVHSTVAPLTQRNSSGSRARLH